MQSGWEWSLEFVRQHSSSSSEMSVRNEQQLLWSDLETLGDAVSQICTNLWLILGMRDGPAGAKEVLMLCFTSACLCVGRFLSGVSPRHLLSLWETVPPSQAWEWGLLLCYLSLSLSINRHLLVSFPATLEERVALLVIIRAGGCTLII